MVNVLENKNQLFHMNTLQSFQVTGHQSVKDGQCLGRLPRASLFSRPTGFTVK